MITDTQPASQPTTVAALYRFTPVDDPAATAAGIENLCRDAAIKGTLIVAGEGLNGTVAGSAPAIDRLLVHLRALPGCSSLDVKFAQAQSMPFVRLRVRVKPEIVTMGVEGIDPRVTVGTYVKPADWNALIADPRTIVVDTRNDYEVAVGTFAGAISPGTRGFREFPDWAAENLDPADKRPVAMFCTGGIRCEKATALLKARGFTEVYHLEGGILRYLEEVAAEHSLWRGDCFVFDERVSVGHGLEQGSHVLCRACGMPQVAEAGGGYAKEPCAACRVRDAKRASGVT